MSVQPYTEATTELTLSLGQVDLYQWANDASQTYKIAEMLADTAFVPPSLAGKPQDICATILYGREVGLSPMLAVQHVQLIERRPTMSALSMRALAQSKGVKFRLDESTDTRCKMSALAPGDRDWTTITWTFDRAKKLGVTSKQNWQKQPQAMLVARATSELCRLVAAPMFLGLPYTTEELSDGVDSPPPVPAEPERAEPVRTVKRAPLKATATVSRPEPQPEPKPEPKPADEGYSTADVQARPMGEQVERPDMVTGLTRRKLTEAFNQYGMTGRTTRLAYVSDVLGREVDSINQVTEAEATRVLDQLEDDHGQTVKPLPAGDDDKAWPDPAVIPSD